VHNPHPCRRQDPPGRKVRASRAALDLGCRLMETLDDLTRILRDEQAGIVAKVPIEQRVVWPADTSQRRRRPG